MSPGQASPISRDAIKRIEFSVDALEKLMNERDKRYDDRDRANQEALGIARLASERALEKTERALKEYKEGANEWREAMKDLVNLMPTRIEVTQQFTALEGKIADLRESRSKGSGRDEMMANARSNQQWVVGIGVTILLFLFGNVVVIWNGLQK